MSCNAPARHATLTFFFDGVPPLEEEPAVVASVAATTGVRDRTVGYREHGPYAAKLCNACHESATSNTYVVPREQLCFRCHDFPAEKKYLHGPLASGGCTACHDPHSSQYRYLLIAATDNFCDTCHERAALSPIPGHEATAAECTSCHDPHMSDRRYLLR